MSIIGNNILAGASGNQGYEIQRSLRFNDGDSAYLRKSDFGTPDSSTTFTFSAWVKRGELGDYFSIAGSDSGSNAFTFFGISSNDKLVWRVRNSSSSDLTRLESEALLRDPSAWYHLLLQRDSTQSTAADRAKLYINGVQVTDFSTNNTDELNRTYTSDFLQDINIGRFQVNSSTRKYSDGYIAEYYYIDGTALGPSSFTETDPTTGQLIPKKYSGSFGTNGFYLNFSDNSGVTATTLGKDSSGNGNNFTPNNLSVTAGTGNDSLEDTPTNNWCTLNPLNTDNVSTFSNGNLDTVCNNASTSGGSIAVNSGKWYAEVVCTAKTATNAMVGICTIDGFDGERQVDESQNGGSGHGYVMNATKLPGGASYGATWAIDDVIGIALDLDSAQNTVTFYKNGASQGAININNAEYVFACSNGQGSSTITYTYNFGQRAFDYTPPTGFKALNTANLLVPTIKDGTEYMQSVLYTGNATARSITGVGFQPDWTWIKGRTTTSSHVLTDSVRGATKILSSHVNNAESTDADTLTSFDSDGFSIGVDVKVNTNSHTYVAWNWKAGGATESLSTGTITSTVSRNVDAGFSIVSYTGNGTAGATIGHGLGVTPAVMIVKNRDATDEGMVYHKDLDASNPSNFYLKLFPATAASGSKDRSSIGSPWNDTEPTSSVFSVSSEDATNASGEDYIAYIFAEVEGYSKFGSYTGNGIDDGPFVYCGFKPSWVLTKVSSGTTGSWNLFDAARDPHNEVNRSLLPNSGNGEDALTTQNDLDFCSNGFKIRENNNNFNGSGHTFIFMAFAEAPFKYANAR